MFEQSFKNIDNSLRTDSGCATELDYVEQTSWILFLKYLDDLEETKKTEAALAGKKYKYILSAEYRWNAWACPKNGGGKLDHNKAFYQLCQYMLPDYHQLEFDLRVYLTWRDLPSVDSANAHH